MTDTMREPIFTIAAGADVAKECADKIRELQAAQADARALVGDIIGALECAQRAYLSHLEWASLQRALTKAQAFMEGK